MKGIEQELLQLIQGRTCLRRGVQRGTNAGNVDQSEELLEKERPVLTGHVEAEEFDQTLEKGIDQRHRTTFAENGRNDLMEERRRTVDAEQRSENSTASQQIGHHRQTSVEHRIEQTLIELVLHLSRVMNEQIITKEFVNEWVVRF